MSNKDQPVRQHFATYAVPWINREAEVLARLKAEGRLPKHGYGAAVAHPDQAYLTSQCKSPGK